ncbi:DNA-directed RNA polymerase I complex subunit Rpa34 [Schizosaccharomyces japonicus yFS275]|uniref:DNA-directed RNA polymerase I complex subunit Rpa34 n=1 Tax=Schizosaccharomyces japonicus (strain yFS275 / FY16936) TaxID=402676 RepID=B6K4B4_SCHJY|nr:DNA-directed RNA polymerase I complex subunit Rpa34 [Schizosaccharomyces japonicus yFS275]EEB08321.1 DNA-directed RNA polymerase I complex subunit Rpa34 [Schizosaccharomyces japonicus yFS275]
MSKLSQERVTESSDEDISDSSMEEDAPLQSKLAAAKKPSATSAAPKASAKAVANLIPQTPEGFSKIEGQLGHLARDFEKEDRVVLVRLPPSVTADDIEEMQLGKRATIKLKDQKKACAVVQNSATTLKVFVPQEDGVYVRKPVLKSVAVVETPEFVDPAPDVKVDREQPTVPQPKDLYQHFHPIGDVQTTGAAANAPVASSEQQDVEMAVPENEAAPAAKSKEEPKKKKQKKSSSSKSDGKKSSKKRKD